MGIATITSTKTGQTFDVDFTHPPTVEDVDYATSLWETQFYQREGLDPSIAEQGVLGTAGNAFARDLGGVALDTVGGVAKGAAETKRALGPAGEVLRLMPGMSTVMSLGGAGDAVAGFTDAVRERGRDVYPTNPANPVAETIGGGAGQAVAMLGTMGAAAPVVGTGAALTVVPSVLGGTMGLGSGIDTAKDMGIDNPAGRLALGAAFGGAEALTERLGGIGGKAAAEALQQGVRAGLKQAGKSVLSEAIEEPISGTLQDAATFTAGQFVADPNRPGYTTNGTKLPALDAEFLKRRKLEAIGGAAGGVVFGGLQMVGTQAGRGEEGKRGAGEPGPPPLPVREDLGELTAEDVADLEEATVQDSSTVPARAPILTNVPDRVEPTADAPVLSAAESSGPVPVQDSGTVVPQVGDVVSYEGYDGRLQQDGQRLVVEVPNGPVVEVADPAGVQPAAYDRAAQVRMAELQTMPDPQVSETQFSPAGDGTLSIKDSSGNTYVPHNDQLLRSVRTNEAGGIEVLLRNPKRPGQVIKLTGKQAEQAQEAILSAAINVEDQGGKVRYGTSQGLKNLQSRKRSNAGSTTLPDAAIDALVNMAQSAVRAGKKFTAWLAEMVARFGEAVRGYAVDAWDAAHARLGRTPREWQFGGNKGTMPSAHEGGFRRPVMDELKVLKDKFKDVPKFTPFKAALNGWVGRSQTNVLAVSKLMTELERRVPDAVAREGITNYIQADGDDALLAAREAASKGRVRDGYRAARNLSPEALAEAARIRDFYDRALQHAQAEGLDVKELDNYVNQVWKKPALPQKRQAFAQFQTELSRSFQFAKHRKLESFFEGEQAGFEPATKDISKLMGLYLNELNKTISTRKMIAELTQGRASDGKPLAVPRGGAVMTQEGVPGEVTLVLPGAQGSVKFEGVKYDVRDYKRLDHSALAAWKFVTADSEGKPVMVLGELALHPEAIDTIRKALGRSKIREFMDSESENVFGHLARKGVKALDVVQSQIKAMMMSLSPFHIVQEGTHAIGHKVNPFFNIPTIDPGNPLHVDAMNHGLMLASERVGIDHFMDGLSGRGSWLEKVPGIGKAVRAMGDYTFHTYIPGLKMKTYDHILHRNTERFKPEVASGKMTADDVKYLSAKQTNAAYGHLNYKDMGRDPTMQHLMRMILLAPDFLEARAKFTGQSMQGIGSKLGREQLAAMGTLAITFFVSARIGNALANNGDMKMDHPFEFVIGNRVYSFRSVPEDIYRLMHRPQQFVAGRVAPVIGTGALEGLFGVNYRGEKIDGADVVQDVLTNAIPMSVRMLPGIRELVKAQKNHPVTPWEQFIGSIGVQIGRHSPITALQREAMKFAKASGVEDRGSYPISKYQQLRYALEDLNWDKAALEMQTLVKEKNGRKGELRDGFKSSLFRHWTGTREMDAAWKSTMKPEQKEMLLHAEERRQLVWQRFIKMLAQ